MKSSEIIVKYADALLRRRDNDSKVQELQDLVRRYL